MMKMVASALCIFGFTLTLAGQDFCSLAVRVLSPNGRRPEVSVSVIERNGRTVDKEQDFTKDVQFCDLGGLPVTVRVGNEGSCNEVIVRDVPVSWNKPYLLQVTYDPMPCLEESPPVPVPICRIVFRVSLADKWEPAASVLVSRPATRVMKTDRFGRASFVVKLGDEVEGLVTVGTIHSTVFKFQCTRDERVHEERIVLEPDQKK